MSDLTETIARLRALRDAWDEAIESGPSSKIEDAYNAVTEAVMDDLDALLDAADPETLRFVLHKPSGVYRALAADAAFYELRPEYSGRGTVMERQDGYALVVPNERAWTHYPSLDSVIEAAREHDRRRRGAK